MIALLASFVIATNATPRELVESCRAMIPADIEIRGEINLRNRRGISQARHTYELARSNSVTRLKKFGDRWMANVMEVETIGSGHRTKITVDDLK